MWSSNGYRKLVRASGIYDFAVTMAFVTPWSFALLHGWTGEMQQALGLGGPLSAFDPLQIMMANMMGSIVCIWAWLRIRDPQQRFGRYDAVGRLLFMVWQGYALMHGATVLVAVVLLLEGVWAVAQLLPVRQSEAQQQSSTPAPV